MSPALTSAPNLTLVIPGEPAQIERLAESIKRTRELLSEVDITLTHNGTRVILGWEGGAADAYLFARSTVLTLNLRLLSHMDEVAQVFEAYAQRIRLGQEYFEELLVNAAQVGLKVVGKTIHHPTTWLDHIPAWADRHVNGDGTVSSRFNRPVPQNRATMITGNVGSREHEHNDSFTLEFNEFMRYQRLVSTYNEVSAKVGTWHRELEEWLTDHMVPLVSCLDELAEIPRIYEALRSGTEAAVDAGLAAMANRAGLDLISLRKIQAEHSRQATDALVNSLLGNSIGQGTYRGFDLNSNKATIAGLEADIQRVQNHTRILRGVGTAGTVASIIETADGVIHGTLDGGKLLESSAGVVGGGAAAKLATAVGYTAAGASTVAVGAGVVAAGAGKLWWEGGVDLKTKDAVNFWLNASVGWDPHDATLKAAYFDKDQLPYLVDELGPLP